MKKIAYSFLCLTFIFCISCQEQEVAIPIVDAPGSERVILLEDLTGVKCSNCPIASTIAKDIMLSFPGKVVVIGIHGDLLSEPTSGSKYDFRFDEARDLENYLKPWFGKPAGAINRVQFEGEPELAISTPETWSNLAQQELNKEHQMDLAAVVTYDETTRQVSIEIGARAVKNLEGTYNISVMLTESHIVDAQDEKQSDGSVITLQDYEHDHVLRMMLTAFDGDSFGVNPEQGVLVNRTFTTTLPDEDGTWIADNMEVVVFVHRVDGGTKEVIQAFQAHVVE